MGNKSQLRSGVVLTYLNLALGSLIPMFYTPVMLRILGQSEYGLYGLASSVTGYLSLLNFGLGSTIIRYLSVCRADNDKDSEERMMGLFIVLYCIISVLILIGGWILSSFVEPIFHKGLTADELAKIKILIRIMAFNMAMSLPISVFGSVVTAHEKYLYRQCVNIFSTIAAPISNLVALYMGFASVGMALASTVMQFIMLPVYAVYCIKNLRLFPKFGRFPVKMIKEILSFSLYVFIGSIVDMLFWATDKVILGMEASTIAIAIYNIGVTFNSIFTNISTAISGVLQPKLTIMVKRNASKSELTDIFIKIGRLQFLMISLVLSGFIVFGRQFLYLWAGPDYSISYYIALITLIPLTIPLIQNSALSILYAMNQHKFRSLVYLAIAIVNVISTYLLVPYMGGFGAALCSGVSYVVGQGIIMNIFYNKKIGLNIWLFWKNMSKIAIVAFALLVSGFGISMVINFSNGWAIFFIGVIIYTIAYTLLSYKFSMNTYEREIIQGVIHKVRRFLFK